MHTNERVFCLRRDDLAPLFGGILPQGAFAGPAPESLLALGQHFLPRPEAETDPAYKQIIPYQVFSCAGRFFVYRRGGGVGESRLAGRLSLGIGGHVNRDDSDDGRLTPRSFAEALHRERQEELVCGAAIPTSFLGWINDDSDPVGQVHLGAVHLCKVADHGALTIRPQGEDIHPLGWWSAAEIAAQGERFEKWSLLAMELVATNG